VVAQPEHAGLTSVRLVSKPSGVGSRLEVEKSKAAGARTKSPGSRVIAVCPAIDSRHDPSSIAQ
jgi:hypothetical protein